MTRFELVPAPTGDRRHLILQVVPVSRRERARRLAAASPGSDAGHVRRSRALPGLR